MPRKKKTAEAATVTGTETISKMEAVRRAIAEGVDMPSEGPAFIKERFGLDVSGAMFSAYKSQIKAKDAKKAGPTKNKGGRPKGSGKKAPASGPAASNGSALEAASAVKDLVDRFGADTVRGLADLFGK